MTPSKMPQTPASAAPSTRLSDVRGAGIFEIRGSMRQIVLNLPDALYLELEVVSARVREHGYGPTQWAQEVIEADLASRRLPKVALGVYGARIGTPEVVEAEEADEPEGYPVRWPEED